MINPDHVFAVVETAQLKAPLIRSALLQMPHLEAARASLEATDAHEWEYAVLLGLVCTGRAFLLSRTDAQEHDTLTEDIDAVLDDHVGTASNEFPSLDLEEFDAELRAVLGELVAAIPTLAFSDRFDAALGERVCKWACLVEDPGWKGATRQLLHMTIGRVCAMTTHGNLAHLA